MVSLLQSGATTSCAGGGTPASRYTFNPRPFPPVLPRLEYEADGHMHTGCRQRAERLPGPGVSPNTARLPLVVALGIVGACQRLVLPW